MSSGEVLLSVVVPVYNVRDYLGECLDSVLEQPGFDPGKVEVVAVDDGSTDGSREILEEYERLGKIRLVKKENGGVSSARNEGIRAAWGKFLTFLDGDDFFIEDSLSSLLGFLEGADFDVMWSRAYEVFQGVGSGRVLWESPALGCRAGSFLDAREALPLGGEFVITVWRYVCKRDFILEKGLFFVEGMLYEDVVWTTDVLLACEGVFCADLVWYVYRKGREGSIMNTLTPERFGSYVDVINLNNARLEGCSDPSVRDELYKLNAKFLSAIAWLLMNSEDIVTKRERDFYFGFIWGNRNFFKRSPFFRDKVRYAAMSLMGMNLYSFLWKRYVKFRIKGKE